MEINDIKFITSIISRAKKMYEPKVKSDPNTIKVKIDPLKKPKLSPEELEEDMKANRGVGPHVNKKDKRSKNPFKSDWD